MPSLHFFHFSFKNIFGLFTAFFERVQWRIKGKQRSESREGTGQIQTQAGCSQPCGIWALAHHSELKRHLTIPTFHCLTDTRQVVGDCLQHLLYKLQGITAMRDQSNNKVFVAAPFWWPISTSSHPPGDVDTSKCNTSYVAHGVKRLWHPCSKVLADVFTEQQAAHFSLATDGWKVVAKRSLSLCDQGIREK